MMPWETYAGTVRDSDELRRVYALPSRVEPPTGYERLSELFRLPGSKAEFRPIQAQALAELRVVEGLIGLMRVGSGKTLVTRFASEMFDVQKPLLIVPAKLIEKTKREFAELDKEWRTPQVPITLMSYERLGRARWATYLEETLPDMIICDEAHRLKNPRAAVTRRVHRFIKEWPDTRFVALSGTLTRRSLMDFAHLAEWALGDGAPIPLQWPDLQEWCAALDEDSLVQGRFAPGALEVFMYPDEEGLEAVRRGVKRRIISTPGVVATEESPIDASLLIDDWWPSYQPPEVIVEATKRLHDDWETPDDVLLTSAADVWRHARELALGFYYRWNPRPPDWWLDPRREWSAFVRATLLRSRTLDSEQQVAEIHREARIYLNWAEVRDQFKPNIEAVWLDTTVMSFVAGWTQEPGIVWVEHQAVADKLVEFGVPYYGRMGLNRFGQPIEDAEGGIAASIEANKEGRNLQKYNRNLVLSPPTTGQAWEQLLGRTHRDGQKADEVLVEVFFGCTENIKAFFQAMNDARYQRGITGTPQKLLEATVAFSDFTSKSKVQG